MWTQMGRTSDSGMMIARIPQPAITNVKDGTSLAENLIISTEASALRQFSLWNRAACTEPWGSKNELTAIAHMGKIDCLLWKNQARGKQSITEWWMK